MFPARSSKLILYATRPSLCKVELTSNEAVQLLPLVLLISKTLTDSPEIEKEIDGLWIVSLAVNANVMVS